MVASPEAVPLFDAEPARAFLRALGKDPASAWFRGIRKGQGARKLQGFNPEVLNRWQADGLNLYVVINDGGNKKDDITACRAIWCEWDDKPVEWQMNAWRELGLPEPSIQNATGGKSIHCYWTLKNLATPQQWAPLQARLIAVAGSDPDVKDLPRVMRLPGSSYIGPDGQPTGARAELIHTSTARYSIRELERFLPALPAPPAPAPLLQALPAPPPATGDPVPFREFITKAAAQLIDTGSREGSCNQDGLALSLELVAVEAWLQAQGAAADETARDAYACYLSHCPDTIGGAPFDTAAAWARFEGAADRQPRPSTPEDKLLQRLAFHRRKATRPADKKVVPLRSQQPAQAAAQGGGDELPYLPAIAKGIPDGWIPRKDGSLSRLKIESGDLSGLLRRYFPGRLTFNLLTMAAEANGQEIKEADVDDCAVLLSEKGYKVTDQVNCAALLRVAREHSYDPVKQYLETVAADSLLEPADLGAAAATYLNASDPLYSAMLRAWLIGAVARIFDPGCQMDYCLVLQSSVQGLFKSTFFKTLASPDWFTSSIPEAEKDFLLNVHRCWIFELAELDSYTSKRDAGRVKNIITTTTDFLRVPYGKATEPRLRRSVFASTCNRDDFLKDDAGSRRFWIIPITRKIDCNRVLQDRDAIWKAAVLAYRSRALPMLTDEQQANSDDLNRGYTVQDPWMGMLVRWLRGESLMERRDGDPAPVSPEQPFTTAEALYSAGIRRPSAIGRSDETNLGPLLKELGFEKRRLSSGRDRAYRWFRRES